MSKQKTEKKFLNKLKTILNNSKAQNLECNKTITINYAALKQFDQQNDKNYVFEIPYGSVFRIKNGKIFKKIAVRTKRYECLEISSGRLYLFNPNAEVELLPSH